MADRQRHSHTVASAEISSDPAFTRDPESFRDSHVEGSKCIRVVIEVAKARKIFGDGLSDRVTAVVFRFGRGIVQVRITGHKVLRTTFLRIS